MLTEELQDALIECYRSTATFAKTLFPERFSLPFSNLHRQICDILDDESEQKIVIQAPRGIGKTSLVQLAFAAKEVLFREKRFLVMISNTATQAVLQTENLKDEFTKNELIYKLFGEIKSDRFSKEQWVTSTGSMIMPRGSGQQVRGLLYGNHRPDLIICDDLEDAESVRNEELRLKLKDWFFADVMKAVSLQNWRIVVIGTLLHEDSLLANLLELPGWRKLELELFDDNGVSNWPERYSDKEIEELIAEHDLAGTTDVLYRELRGKAINTKDAKFRKQDFKYYDDTQVDSRRIESVVLLDPAKSTTIHSAESAIVCWGIDVVGNRLLLRDLVAKKMHPDVLYDELFDMCKRTRSHAIGVETTSLHDWILFPLKNEMARRNLNYELVDLTAVGKKEDRAAWLIPLYRRGLVYHNRTVSAPLEAQLLSYPRNKRWDCIDAAAYIVKMLEKGGRYFLPALSDVEKEELGFDPGEEPLEGEPEEPELETDEDADRAMDLVIDRGSWRTI